MGEEHELNETLVGGELVDRDETPEPSPEMAARVAAARGNSGRSAPSADESTAGGEVEEDNSDDTASREPTDTSVDGLDDGEETPEPKAEAKAEDEPADIDRLDSALDEIERVESPQAPQRQPKAKDDDDTKGPSVRQAADEIEAERLRKVVEQYGKDDPLVEHLRAMEARHQAQIQAIQAGNYRSEREMHKARLFSEPLEKAAPGIFGDRDSRAKNPKQARAYEAAAEATTAVAESIIADAARRNPLVAKILKPHHIAGMVANAMAELSGVPIGAAAAGAAERKKIAATLAARQSNAGVGSRPSGAERVRVPQNREEAKQFALEKSRNKRARNARK